MSKSYSGSIGISCNTVVLSAAAVVVAALWFGSSAVAAVYHPTGAYVPFADCPLGNPMVEECLVATITSGELVIGEKAVPITNAITLQGGTHENDETGALNFVGAENGLTLSKTAQPVRGGLAGLLPGEVNATVELAGPATSIGINFGNLIEGKGIALSLPVKLHLENSLFGSECYLGSNAKPIGLELTTGRTAPPPANNPITGSPGKLSIKERGGLLAIASNSLVNNSFVAPEAKGCGGALSSLFDPAIDLMLGVPSAAGHNTAILDGTLNQAAAALVR